MSSGKSSKKTGFQFLSLQPQSAGRPKWVINEECIPFFLAIKTPVATIAPMGRPRAGKTWLMKHVIAEDRSLNSLVVGHTEASCTRGIWVCVKQLERTNAADQTYTLVPLDPEGLGDSEVSNKEHDNMVFMMTVLLSKMVIMNVKGTITEHDIDTLAIGGRSARDLAKRIMRPETAAEASNAMDQSVDAVTEDQVTAEVEKLHREAEADRIAQEQVSQYFPSLTWLIRDLTLDLKRTPAAYLQGVLSEEGKKSAEQLRARQIIKTLFKESTCSTMCFPVANANDCVLMDKMADQDLVPQFVREKRAFREHVFRTLDEPNRWFASGSDFVDWVRMLVRGMNADGAMPEFQDMVALQAERRLRVLAENARDRFRKMLAPMISDQNCARSCAEPAQRFAAILKPEVANSMITRKIDDVMRVFDAGVVSDADTETKQRVRAELAQELQQCASTFLDGNMALVRGWVQFEASALRQKISSVSNVTEFVSSHGKFVAAVKSTVGAGPVTVALLQEFFSGESVVEATKAISVREVTHLTQQLEEAKRECQRLIAKQGDMKVLQEDVANKSRLVVDLQADIEAMKDELQKLQHTAALDKQTAAAQAETDQHTIQTLTSDMQAAGEKSEALHSKMLADMEEHAVALNEKERVIQDQAVAISEAQTKLDEAQVELANLTEQVAEMHDAKRLGDYYKVQVEELQQQLRTSQANFEACQKARDIMDDQLQAMSKLNQEAVQTIEENEQSFNDEKGLLELQLASLQARFDTETEQARHEADLHRTNSEQLEMQLSTQLAEKARSDKQIASLKHDVLQLNETLMQKQDEYQRALVAAQQRTREEAQARAEMESKHSQQRSEDKVATLLKLTQAQTERETARAHADTFEKNWKASSAELQSMRKARDELQRQCNALQEKAAEARQLAKDRIEKDSKIRELQASLRDRENQLQQNKRTHEMELVSAKVKLHRGTNGGASVAGGDINGGGLGPRSSSNGSIA
jgi:hypothetical protein